MDTGQGAHRYNWSATNPNDASTGACMCSPGGRCEDRGGPYKVYFAAELEATHGGGGVIHAVECYPCSRTEPPADLLQIGEPVYEASSELIGETFTIPTPESPVAEGHYPDLDTDDELAI